MKSLIINSKPSDSLPGAVLFVQTAIFVAMGVVEMMMTMEMVEMMMMVTMEMMIIMMMIMSTARWCDLGASGCLCLPVCGHHRAFVVIIRIIEIIADNIIQHPGFADVMF